jgi:transaldolase
MSKVVADTGEIGLIERYHPVDVTTNPSLVYKAVESNENLLNQEFGRNVSVSAIADRLNVHIGSQILKIIPGRVSTEVDAKLSYDTVATYMIKHCICWIYILNKATTLQEFTSKSHLRGRVSGPASVYKRKA